jgi:hypothetical protein
VVRRYPFVIRLKHNLEQLATQPIAMKIDPGAKTTGMALIRLTTTIQVAGYELREYLLEKWGRKCAYCDKENVPLQIEHITAKAIEAPTASRT